MWSGPRNISTAMMRSWEARSDTFVCDEPLYAYYLRETRLPHPGADQIIAHYETDLPTVIDWLTGPVPEGRAIFYQKHMSHHLLAEVGLDWLDRMTNCFLIRDPAQVINSLRTVISNPTIDQTGLPQQVELLELVMRQSGRVPPVLDCRDVLLDPASMLRKLCAMIGVPYTDQMLSWAPGRRPTDGIWARYWYGAVERSTGFGPPEKPPKSPARKRVPEHLGDLLDECDELYRQLYRHRLT